MYLFLSSAAGTDAAAGGGSMIIMMVVLIAVFYFLMIRPENKRKKEAEAMRNALKVGDNITTIGGIIGDIVSVKDDSIVLETSSDRVRVEFAKFAVSTNTTAEKEAAKKRTAAASGSRPPASPRMRCGCCADCVLPPGWAFLLRRRVIPTAHRESSLLISEGMFARVQA